VKSSTLLSSRSLLRYRRTYVFRHVSLVTGARYFGHGDALFWSRAPGLTGSSGDS
jgi:hypothetical protein